MELWTPGIKPKTGQTVLHVADRRNRVVDVVVRENFVPAGPTLVTRLDAEGNPTGNPVPMNVRHVSLRVK